MSSLSQTVRAQVRVRADGACEYCRVHESDSAATTTFEVDHISPQHLFALDDPACDDLANLGLQLPPLQQLQGQGYSRS